MPTATDLSARIFRIAILCYPRDFRREYADEMTTVFSDQLREARHEEGTAGIFRLWACALRELFTVALPLQLRNSVVIASAASLVGTSLIYLALTWALTHPEYVHHNA